MVRSFITLKSRLSETLVSASVKFQLNAIHFFVPDKAYNLLYPEFRLSVTYCPSKQNKQHFGVFTPTVNLLFHGHYTGQFSKFYGCIVQKSSLMETENHQVLKVNIFIWSFYSF